MAQGNVDISIRPMVSFCVIAHETNFESRVQAITCLFFKDAVIPNKFVSFDRASLRNDKLREMYKRIIKHILESFYREIDTYRVWRILPRNKAVNGDERSWIAQTKAQHQMNSLYAELLYNIILYAYLSASDLIQQRNKCCMLPSLLCFFELFCGTE